MTNDTIYLLETLVVTVPAAGGILYIVNNLRTKLKAALEKIADYESYISGLDDKLAKAGAALASSHVKLCELERHLNEREATAPESFAPGTSKITEISLEPGPVGDPIKLHLTSDRGTTLLEVVTMEQVRDAILKAAPLIAAQAMTKMTRREGI